MLRIRLSRTGKKKQPSYRIVVADADAKRDGRYVERIGYYNPLTEPADYRIDEERALYWLSVGAQPSDAVRRLLDQQGTFDRLSRLRQGESKEALAAEALGEAQAAVIEAPQGAAEKVAEGSPVAEALALEEEE
jgi:small subunit ribosomal protein S16